MLDYYLTSTVSRFGLNKIWQPVAVSVAGRGRKLLRGVGGGEETGGWKAGVVFSVSNKCTARRGLPSHNVGTQLSTSQSMITHYSTGLKTR